MGWDFAGALAQGAVALAVDGPGTDLLGTRAENAAVAAGLSVMAASGEAGRPWGMATDFTELFKNGTNSDDII